MHKNVIDEKGNRHGCWLVISRAQNNSWGAACWHCRCDCGETRTVAGSTLRGGGSQSCGCLKRKLTSQHKLIDLSGKRFGQWTIIERTKDSKNGKVCWLCKCSCGTEKVVLSVYLRNGESLSCGCLFSLPAGEAAFNQLFARMKRSAKKRGHRWALTKEEVRILTQQDCYYCGIEPQQIAGNANAHDPYIYNGIDRKNSELGYAPENVVSCCKHCNRAKYMRTIEQFESWICQAYKHIKYRKDSPK